MKPRQEVQGQATCFFLCLIDTDLDGTAIYSKKPVLTRKLTSVVAASVPNRNSGRELPALARQARLKEPLR
jgi:hypothetical protein